MKKFKTCLVTTLIVVVGLSGCTSYNGINLHKQTYQSVNRFSAEPPLWKGDKIRYELKSGQKGTMTISSVTPDTLLAEDGKVIELNNIASLERKDLARAKTAAAGLSASALFFVILVSAGLASALISAG